MSTLSDISKTIASMPIEGLIAAVMLAGFALAGYAIYAMLAVSKERR
jgi:hypothetical protein